MLNIRPQMNNTDFVFSSTTSVKLANILLPLGAFVIIINVMCSLALYRCKRMDYKLRQFSICLAMTDILVGTHLDLMVLVYNYDATRIRVFCYIILILPRFTAFIGMFVTTAFAIDRYLSLYYSRSYNSLVNRPFNIFLCVSMWTFAVFLTGISFRGKEFMCTTQIEIDRDRELRSPFVLIPIMTCFGLITFSYIAVFANIRKHLHQIRNLGIEKREYAFSLFHSTFVLGCLILAYLACYGPIFVLKFHNYLHPETINETKAIRTGSQLFYVSNSVINPIIYSARFPECRLEIMKIFWFWNREKKEEIDRKKKLLTAPFLYVKENSAFCITHM